MVSRFSRFLVMAVLAVSGLVMLAAPFDAEARRFGGGGSFGRQSSNIFKQRPAAPAPKAAAPAAASKAAPQAARQAGQAAPAARSGLSRFMAPLAGIIAGLGIAALLSHLGLSGAFFELLFLVAFIAVAIFAIRFVLRRLGNPGAVANAAAGRGTASPAQPVRQQPMARTSLPEAHSAPAASASQSAPPADPAWFIPADFDVEGFLENAKAQFIAIQGYWDKGDLNQLGQYLTDDLLAELKPQIEGNSGHTEVLLLNAELLGIETLPNGHLASVRYSGMLREAPGAEAAHIEEVWNLYKASDSGWLLAGIQQAAR